MEPINYSNYSSRSSSNNSCQNSVKKNTKRRLNPNNPSNNYFNKGASSPNSSPLAVLSETIPIINQNKPELILTSIHALFGELRIQKNQLRILIKKYNIDKFNDDLTLVLNKINSDRHLLELIHSAPEIMEIIFTGLGALHAIRHPFTPKQISPIRNLTLNFIQHIKLETLKTGSQVNCLNWLKRAMPKYFKYDDDENIADIFWSFFDNVIDNDFNDPNLIQLGKAFAQFIPVIKNELIDAKPSVLINEKKSKLKLALECLLSKLEAGSFPPPTCIREASERINVLSNINNCLKDAIAAGIIPDCLENKIPVLLKGMVNTISNQYSFQFLVNVANIANALRVYELENIFVIAKETDPACDFYTACFSLIYFLQSLKVAADNESYDQALVNFASFLKLMQDHAPAFSQAELNSAWKNLIAIADQNGFTEKEPQHLSAWLNALRSFWNRKNAPSTLSPTELSFLKKILNAIVTFSQSNWGAKSTADALFVISELAHFNLPVDLNPMLSILIQRLDNFFDSSHSHLLDEYEKNHFARALSTLINRKLLALDNPRLLKALRYFKPDFTQTDSNAALFDAMKASMHEEAAVVVNPIASLATEAPRPLLSQLQIPAYKKKFDQHADINPISSKRRVETTAPENLPHIEVVDRLNIPEADAIKIDILTSTPAQESSSSSTVLKMKAKKPPIPTNLKNLKQYLSQDGNNLDYVLKHSDWMKKNWKLLVQLHHEASAEDKTAFLEKVSALCGKKEMWNQMSMALNPLTTLAPAKLTPVQKKVAKTQAPKKPVAQTRKKITKSINNIKYFLPLAEQNYHSFYGESLDQFIEWVKNRGLPPTYSAKVKEILGPKSLDMVLHQDWNSILKVLLPEFGNETYHKDASLNQLALQKFLNALPEDLRKDADKVLEDMDFFSYPVAATYHAFKNNPVKRIRKLLTRYIQQTSISKKNDVLIKKTVSELAKDDARWVLINAKSDQAQIQDWFAACKYYLDMRSDRSEASKGKISPQFISQKSRHWENKLIKEFSKNQTDEFLPIFIYLNKSYKEMAIRSESNIYIDESFECPKFVSLLNKSASYDNAHKIGIANPADLDAIYKLFSDPDIYYIMEHCESSPYLRLFSRLFRLNNDEKNALHFEQLADEFEKEGFDEDFLNHFHQFIPPSLIEEFHPDVENSLEK